MEAPTGIIETRSLSEQVYQYLCLRIIEGSISYGEILNIKQIASTLSVSPMPVREAVKRLEHEGIVDRMKPVVSSKPTEQTLRKYIALDRQFPTEICRLAGNELINKCYREANLHLSMRFITGEILDQNGGFFMD